MPEWKVPGYTELRALGSGGFGDVVLARHEESGTLVAIKYLHRDLLADPGFAAMFRGEAAVLASLDDPNVVRLHEYVEGPAGAAIVMELVDGCSVREILARQGATTAEAALVVLQGSLLGLAAAHWRGVVHRDYKPENVLVNGNGVSKLTDFGIAARAGDRPIPAGTLAYAPPEQFAGAPASPAGDVYAATATFYECLAGRPPFTGQTTEALLAQHRSEQVPLDAVPEPLRPLVASGLAKDPGDRPADAAAFVAGLRVVAADAYGQDWEARGRSHLAEAALLLAALWPSGVAPAVVGAAVEQVSLPHGPQSPPSPQAPRESRHLWHLKHVRHEAHLRHLSRLRALMAVAAAVGVGAVAAVVVVTIGSSHSHPGPAAPPASAAATLKTLKWTAAEDPMPADLPGQGSFDGVACTAPGTCLMAGPYTDSASNYSNYGVVTDIASHGTWAPATYTSIDMGGTANIPVNGVACAPAGNCMTVGQWLNPSTGYYTGMVDTLANGTWTPSRLSLPANLGPDQEMELHAVACPAVGNCVVVGSNYPSAGNNGWGLIQTLADGTWTAIEAPLPADAAQGDKAGGNLYGVTCTAPGACVAVGFYTQADGASQGLIETLRNGTWTPITAPPLTGEPGQVWLVAVSCATTTSCAAVGYITGRDGLIETLANGAWHSSVAPVPTGAAGLGSEQLSGVACPADGACVAVGYVGTDQKSQGVIDTLANGTWTAATAPLPANAARTGQSAGLSAVSCATASYCVASGGYTDDTNHGQALIESTARIATAASAPTAPAPCTSAVLSSVLRAANVPLVLPENWVVQHYACQSGYALAELGGTGYPVDAVFRQQGTSWTFVYVLGEFNSCQTEQNGNIVRGCKGGPSQALVQSLTHQASTSSP
jgi:serine/threonine protein kinase